MSFSRFRLTSQPLSVADRINELEKQQKYSYLDPEKKHKVPDPTLKAIQKKALLSFYERHHNNANATKTNTWKSEPQLAQSPLVAVPQPPPRQKSQTPSRRASCASDYASSASKRSSLASNKETKDGGKITPRHQHSNSCGSLSTDLLGPVIIGPSISLDDWVPEKPPERPPKNPHLRIAYPDLFQDQRVPSPDLPPPSPPTVLEDEVINSDEPLPPPPADLDAATWQKDFDERLKQNMLKNQCTAMSQVELKSSFKTSHTKDIIMDQFKKQTGFPERGTAKYSSVRLNQDKTVHGEHRHSYTDYRKENKVGVQAVNDNRDFANGPQSLVHISNLNEDAKVHHNETPKYKFPGKEQILGFPNQRNYAERSSTRYPSAHKLVLNGNIAVGQKVMNGTCDQHAADPLKAQQPSPVKDHDDYRSNMMVGKQRASIAEVTARENPPPLQPRQMRINQSMRARMSEGRPGGVTRLSPPKEDKLRDPRTPNYAM